MLSSRSYLAILQANGIAPIESRVGEKRRAIASPEPEPSQVRPQYFDGTPEVHFFTGEDWNRRSRARQGREKTR